MSSSRGPIKPWLNENGYHEVLILIEEVEAEWRSLGRKTRRNWWDVLAGDKFGRPRCIEGRTFPVLAAAQERQGVLVTSNALRNSNESISPDVWRTGRWPKIVGE